MLNTHPDSDMLRVRKLLYVLAALLALMIGAVAVFEWQDAKREPQLFESSPPAT